MEFLTKILVFSALLIGTYCRSLRFERNISNYSEGELNNNCSCNLRYFKHYEVRGCIVESEDSCGCPKKFACLFNNDTSYSSSKVCLYQNKEYKVGSKIITSNNCRICRCHEGTPPYISCISKECPSIDYPPEKKCHLVYNAKKCCSVGLECVDSENETGIVNDETFMCEYNGNVYPLGAKIHPIDDPCQICLCNENWNGVNNISCYEQECMLENNKVRLDEGCIPIYHENKCCPIEFYCPSSHNSSFSLASSNETVENNATSENDEVCTFGGQSYELGMELSIENPCVKCSCFVPPDFTCIHQSCPPSPSFENCYPTYNQGGCCPKYECLFGDAEPVPDGCPTPICADSSCNIETPPGHECPTCVCNDRSSFLEQNSVQVQQTSQNMNDLEDEFEGPRQIVDDYSEDELQVIPFRTQDAESLSPVFEKMILEPEEMPQIFDEIPKDNSSEEGEVKSTLESENSIEKTSTLSSVISESNYNSLESNSSELKKNIQKRSGGYYRVMVPIQQQQNTFAQYEENFNENIEREFEPSDKTFEDFDDELESFRNKAFKNNGSIANGISRSTKIETDVDVPPGCPTPMCEGPWCRVGIPRGGRCPTCICKRFNNSEP